MTRDDFAAILKEIETSRRGLAKICADRKVSTRSFYDIIEEDAEAEQQYVRARERQADYLADELIEISDNLTIPPDHKRLMTDSRKWTASKLRPKRYGDRLDLNHGGSVGLKLTKIESVIVDPVEQSANPEQQNEIAPPSGKQ